MTLPGESAPEPERNEEVEGIISALNLQILIFQTLTLSNPTKFYILIPTQPNKTLTTGLDTYPKPNPD